MHGSLALSHVLLHAALVKFASAEKNLHIAVLDAPTIETALKNLVRVAEKDALTLRAALAPLTLIDRTIFELTDAGAVPEVILPVSLEDVPVGHDHLTLSVLQSLRDASIVDGTLNLCNLILGFIEELMPVVRHFLGEVLPDH